MTVGERIKQKRIELKLSQDDLAKKVGYKSRSSIQKIEAARKLPLDKVETMALALDCTPGYIMGWENKDRPYAVTEPSVAYVPELPKYNFGDDLDEESIKFAHLFQDASEEERALVMAYLKKKQPKS